MMLELEFDYTNEKQEGLKQLREETKDKIKKINDEIKNLKSEIGYQLAVAELYRHRLSKGQKGWEYKVNEANNKVSELQDMYKEKITELKRDKINLEFDLKSLDEILK